MSHMPENAPEHCPGTQSESAGKEAACQGCPNQKICASGQPQAPDTDVDLIRVRLGGIKHKVLVLSGKGGVGKSTVTTMLARGLASDPAKDVLVLDVDICGPSLPRLFGLEGEQVHQSGSGWSPVFVEENLGVMSVGFLLDSPDAAVIWRGPRKNGLIKQFLRDVDWGTADFLLIDTPPGTSDEHLSIAQYLKEAVIDGAIIVTTPQEISLLDVRKEINFCEKVGIRVLGVVENMRGFVCPKCQTETQIFPPTTGGGQQMAADMGVPFLGGLPLDPRIARCCDEGRNFLSDVPDSSAAAAYFSVINRIISYVQRPGEITAATTT